MMIFFFLQNFSNQIEKWFLQLFKITIRYLLSCCTVVCLSKCWRSINDLGKKEIVFGILKDEVIDVLNDQEQKQYKAVVTYTFDRYSLFPIPRLNLLASTVSINICNYYIVVDDVYYKTGFVEVVEVAILDVVFGTYIGYKLKLYVYKLWIFVEGPLEII